MDFFCKSTFTHNHLFSIAVHASGLSKIAYNNNFNLLPANYIPQEKPITVILYMAADNDLRTFVYRNLEEIKSPARNAGNREF